MPEEVSAARGTLKRLIEAEAQAREILEAAEERAKKTLGHVQVQAKQHIETVRQEMENTLRSRLQEVESKAAAEMRMRLGQIDVEAREIERRANEHFSDAVEMVVSWITRGGE
jgi:vacuolar-type H+-ATPase subunit H